MLLWLTVLFLQSAASSSLQEIYTRTEPACPQSPLEAACETYNAAILQLIISPFTDDPNDHILYSFSSIRNAVIEVNVSGVTFRAVLTEKVDTIPASGLANFAVSLTITPAEGVDGKVLQCFNGVNSTSEELSVIGIPQPSVMKIESTVNQSAVIVLDDTVSANEGYEYTLLVVNDNDTQEVSSQLQTVYIYEVPDFDVVYTARVTVTDQCSRTSVTAQNFKIAGPDFPVAICEPCSECDVCFATWLAGVLAAIGGVFVGGVIGGLTFGMCVYCWKKEKNKISDLEEKEKIK